jgi:hypothetical protein
MQNQFLMLFFCLTFFTSARSQNSKPSFSDSILNYKYSVASPWHSFVNFGEEKTNTQHYELHIKYAIGTQNKVGIKITTWSLFQPMGILWWDELLTKIETESEFYPGRLKEIGFGASYQHLFWKGLFGTVEILPQYKTYYNLNKEKIGTGFKLYTSYHIGYHFTCFKQRVFIEPQLHCQNWMIDTKAPEGFQALDKKWKNYFLFEPNLYIGINF